MSLANQDAKDRIRQAIDIVDLVGGYLPLRRQGRGFVATCPWHDDSRPSLQVNPERQTWKCWVCNIGGDAFSFVMRREGITFPEALRMLGERVGISLEQERIPLAQPGSPDDKKTLYDCMAWAERQFADCLRDAPEAENARRYFADRGLTTETIQRFHLGFAPDSWQWLLDRARTTPYSPAVLQAVGLVNQKEETNRYYDFFRGRVIFPIRDPQSRPVAAGARVLPQSAPSNTGKYINTRETRLFSKSSHLYALDVAREAIAAAKNVVVVEGYMDVIMCHQHGVANVVAVLGTALGSKHIDVLRRYADRITLVLDGDEAGQRRTNEVLELFIAHEVDLRIATLPDELDPCEFLEQRSADELRGVFAEAHDALDHAIRVHTEGFDPLADTHRAHQALERLLAMVAKAPRLSSHSSSGKLLRERQLLSRLAREFQLDEAVLRQRLSELRNSQPAMRGSAASSRVVLGDTPPSPRGESAVARSPLGNRDEYELSTATSAGWTRRDASTAGPEGPNWRRQDLAPLDAEVLEILVRHPELVDTALAELTPEHFESIPGRRLLAAFRATAERGEPCEYLRVLDELEELHWKSLLGELDESAARKEAHTTDDAATRLQRLLQESQYRFQSHQRRQILAALEQKRLNEAEELQYLHRLVQEQRGRQGIPAPTDG